MDMKIKIVTHYNPQNPKKLNPQYQNEIFCLDELIDDLQLYVTNELKKAGKSNVHVEIFKHSKLEKNLINTDRVKLKQIFSILLNNAVKFTDTGYIFFGFHTSTDNRISLFVDDTGNGIFDDDELDLSIADGLIGQLGGNMEITFMEGGGMAVKFHIISAPSEVFENETN